MWNITEGPIPVAPLADHHRYLNVIERGDERRELYAELSGTVATCAPETLADPLGEMVTTQGRTAVERYLSDDEPPAIVRVHTAGWQPVYRELSESSAPLGLDGPPASTESASPTGRGRGCRTPPRSPRGASRVGIG